MIFFSLNSRLFLKFPIFSPLRFLSLTTPFLKCFKNRPPPLYLSNYIFLKILIAPFDTYQQVTPIVFDLIFLPLHFSIQQIVNTKVLKTSISVLIYYHYKAYLDLFNPGPCMPLACMPFRHITPLCKEQFFHFFLCFST